jgi:Iap family predicted aminopeptidase
MALAASRFPIVGLVVFSLATGGSACGPDRGSNPSDTPESAERLVTSLPRAVSPVRMRAHLVALQRIADRHGGTRVAGSAGYAASVRYVRRELARAGYRSTVMPFPFVEYSELVERARQLAPVQRRFRVEAIDYSPSTRSGGVRGTIVPIRGTGCSATDFAGTRDRIALVARGVCFIAQKAQSAQRAGARALLVYTTEAGVPIDATLGDPNGSRIPVAAVDRTVAQSLARQRGARVLLELTTRKRRTTSTNVVADTHDRRGRVLLIGAHLDSVHAGPGINDNGTGVAALLDIARIVRRQAPNVAVRFAFWGAEEFGLFGSRAYAASARPADFVGYLNFDMLGSRAHLRAIYEGPFAPVFLRYFAQRRLAAERIDLAGRSDHAPFDVIGVPTGGLFAGFDACFHRACDRVETVDFQVLEELAAAAAFVIAELAPRRAR